MGNRLLPLDVLRAVAVGLVLWHHAAGAWLHALPLPTSISKAVQRGGWIGVDLFFVLSGFLIGGLLFREHQRYGSIDIRRFFLRRGLKIYPAFYILLATTVLVAYLRDMELPGHVWGEALFIQNYVAGVWGHTWSLAIEEHFYVLLPLLLVGLGRLRRGRADVFSLVPPACLVLGVAVLAARLATAPDQPYRNPTHLYPSHLRIDSLMFGVLLAYLFTFRPGRFGRFFRRHFAATMLTGVALCVPAFLFRLEHTPYLYTFGFTQLYVGCGLIVSALVVRGIPANRLTVAVGGIGAYSYSIYLWHLMMKRWGVEAVGSLMPGPLGPEVQLAVYLAGSLVFGILMARVVEIPVLRLRDRWLPSRSRAVPRPAAQT